MSHIVFKSKVNNSLEAFSVIEFPKKFKKSHCNMNYFRSKSPFREWANSDMFEAFLTGKIKKVLPSHIKLEKLSEYPYITVEGNGYFKTISINVDHLEKHIGGF